MLLSNILIYQGRSNTRRVQSAQVFLEDLLCESKDLIVMSCSKSLTSGTGLDSSKIKRMKALYLKREQRGKQSGFREKQFP